MECAKMDQIMLLIADASLIQCDYVSKKLTVPYTPC